MGITPKNPADFDPSMGAYNDLRPFRFWCQKVLPLVYDDSLSYYEVLCKLVDYLNKTMEDVGVLHDDVDALHTAYQQLQNYVNDYFSTLDVQQEINNKLDIMASDGTLDALLLPYFNAYKNEINGVVSTQNDKISVLESRMDSFARLPDGSTTGDAELIDIRVGANGTTYPTAGDAVRAQIGTLNNKVSSYDELLEYGIITGLNKYDTNTIVDDSNIENNSSLPNYGDVISGSYDVSDFIPVNGGDTVSWYYNADSSATVVVRSTMFRIAEYDANKNVILVTSNWQSSPYATRSNTKYVRTVLVHNPLNMIVLNADPDVTGMDFTPYYGYDELLRIVNIENPLNNLIISTSVNKWNPNDVSKDFGISNSYSSYGELIPHTDYDTSGKIPVIKGQKIMYYYTNDAVPTNTAIGTTVFRLAEYDKNDKCLIVSQNWVPVPYEVQNEETTYVRIEVGTALWRMILIDDDNIYQKPFVYYSNDYNLLSKTVLGLQGLENPAEIILPSTIYGVSGQEINIYKENLVLYNRLKSVAYIHTRLSNNAYQDDFRTIWNPSTEVLTENNISWEIFKTGTKFVNLVPIKECIVPADTGNSNIKVLIMGDSKVQNGFVSYHFLHNFDDDNMSVTLLGTKYSWNPNNRHEGYGSRSAKWFCTDPESPFSNNGEFDFSNYLTTNSIDTPDYVFINLGTNDCASMSGGNDTFLTEFVEYIEEMITSIHSVSSDINVIIGMCEGCATVKDTNNAEFIIWDLNQKISRLHKATIIAFDNRQADNIYVCPMYMGMDLTQDYSMIEVPLSKRDGDVNGGSGDGKTRMDITDRIHQNEVGYWKNADYMYAITKYIVAKSLT